MADEEKTGMQMPFETKHKFQLLMHEWQFKKKTLDATEADFLEFLMDYYKQGGCK